MASPLLTVTLNAAVDKTYTVPDFSLDRVHRPQSMRVTAGGKGINVARVYRTLGGAVTATGFLGGNNGDFLAQCLLAEEIDARFVRLSGESRICIAIMDPLAGTQTEVNEVGPDVEDTDCRDFLLLLRELLPGRSAVIISGSVPPGTPPTIYRDIVRMAQEEFGVRAVLDASGDALKFGIEAKPFLVKPNLHELAVLDIASTDSGQAARMLREKYGVAIALVTAGPAGAVFASREGLWEAVPPTISALSAVGSGDSLAAGFLWAFEQGDTMSEALRIGVAAGAANAMTYGAGFCQRSLIFELAEQTLVRQIR